MFAGPEKYKGRYDYFSPKMNLRRSGVYTFKTGIVTQIP